MATSWSVRGVSNAVTNRSPKGVQEYRRQPDNRSYGEGAALMTDVAQHEATIVRSARREWCETGDLGSSVQARQKVGALVKDHTRK